MSLNAQKNCPECNANWFKGDIYETMLKQNGGNEAAAKKSAECYGWSEENKKFFSNLVGVYDQEADVTVAWQCPACETQWSRFTEKKIVK